MGTLKLRMPSMGEGVFEATLTRIIAQIGDTVGEDEPIVEVATDKVDNEIPSPVEGKILKYLAKEGDVLQVGEIIALIETEAEIEDEDMDDAPSATEAVAGTAPIAEKEEEEEPEIHTHKQQDDGEAMGSRTPSGRFLSPLVRSIAQAEGISMTELDAIKGSASGNRLTKDDLLEYIKNRGKNQTPATIPVTEKTLVPQPKKQSAPPVEYGANYEIVEMDRMRKLIAKHMISSKQTSPHVASFMEVDVTNMVQWRNKVKDDFQKRYGEKLTFTPIFVEAIVKTLKDYPMVNVSVDGENIIIKKDINVGMATALPSGNLIVPVIKNADRLNLTGLTQAVNDLANRARSNKLKPDEIKGGTFTLTNVGTFGNLTGTPIINQPEVAILAVGAIKKKPAVIETPQGDFIGIRHIMIMSMSYDHRVVDGSLGGMFIKRVADYLEAFSPDREI